MSDINTPRCDEHPQEPAEGGGEGGAPDERRHPEEPAEGGDDRTPPDDMSSYAIQPPPTEDGEGPGVPDASGALDGGTDGEPGANATGVGA